MLKSLTRSYNYVFSILNAAVHFNCPEASVTVGGKGGNLTRDQYSSWDSLGIISIIATYASGVPFPFIQGYVVCALIQVIFLHSMWTLYSL